ncbi:MAG: hypothetical protein IJV15_05540 [Lachnospiraceae bacterium]|nr:hypothetical protein [Lachnospiraceae bacterium]
MENLDNKEKIWGGILGTIAIISAICEMVLGGINAASVAGMIKDVSGTLVVVVVLIAFLKSLPKKLKNIEDVLENEVEAWGKDNTPFIFKTTGYEQAKGSEYTQGFCLLQNTGEYISLATVLNDANDEQWQKYSAYRSKQTGKFIDMPSYHDMVSDEFKVDFIMEQEHFKKIENMDRYINDMVKAISIRKRNIINVSRAGEASLRFRVTFNVIQTKEDVDAFVDVLDFILSLVKVIA